MSLVFENLYGEPITEMRIAAMKSEGAKQERRKRAAAKAAAPDTHKGWRVTGIQPGALEEAIESHKRLCELAKKAGGKTPEPFDKDQWLRKAKRISVRSKPYSLEQAARDCKALAEKCGWIELQIKELKKA